VTKKVIGQDLVRVTKTSDSRNLLTILAWGDEIELIGEDGDFLKVEMPYYKEVSGTYEKIYGVGFIKKNTLLHDPESIDILKISFVDVQQGDGMVLQTPKGRLILIDGGDNELFARYMARRFPNYSKENPLNIEAIIVTHGDADHFAGLSEIHKSEKYKTRRNRLFIRPNRIYHNGIVKGPSKKDNKAVPDKQILGTTQQFENRLYLVELHDNLLKIPKDRLNKPFKEWITAIESWQSNGRTEEPMIIKRVQYGDNNLFSFLDDEKIEVEVLGPFVTKVNGKPAVPFLREPSKTPPIEIIEGLELPETVENNRRYSASHTINGHSIVLRLKYGNVRFLLSGDLNQEAEDRLSDLVKEKQIDIKSEVLKVPHHGSADFEPKFLQLVSPVISVISSGDESSRKEYIHPRATLVGSLGRYSRIGVPLIFVTELVAFFEMVGNSTPLKRSKDKPEEVFFAFKRTQFGIVHIRTDGKRVLVFTHSGKRDMKEAYAFKVNANGQTEYEDVIK
jgi:beta-lactamase superfamily II metal-dependent hydrolase